jgi:hypothetical protein
MLSRYTNVGNSDLSNTFHKDLQYVGSTLLSLAVANGDPREAEGLMRAGEAVLIAARKVKKHLAPLRDDDLTD